ncbi:MAG: phage holin family protein [Patescibacteria group bacterium]|nr:phage holin family protein [Patescibacteria group bacterium]
MKVFVNWLISAVAILVTAYLLPGVHVQGFMTALVVSVVLGIVNAVVKPVLVIFTLPITILTLGLFTLVINAFLVLLTSALVPGFKVDGFLTAFLFSLVLSIVNFFLQKIFK